MFDKVLELQVVFGASQIHFNAKCTFVRAYYMWHMLKRVDIENERFMIQLK